jgi:hypothetical protein
MWTVAGVVALAGVALAGCLGEGDHLVGSTLANGNAVPGLWHSAGGDGCYWARRDPFGNIIANSFSIAGPQYAEVKPTDAYFSTSGCAVWVQVDQAFDTKHVITTFGQFADGQYRVGPEVPTGTYFATTPLSCYWERTRDFSGDFSALIDNGLNGAATILPGDVGFSSSGCGIWTKVG